MVPSLCPSIFMDRAHVPAQVTAGDGPGELQPEGGKGQAQTHPASRTSEPSLTLNTPVDDLRAEGLGVKPGCQTHRGQSWGSHLHLPNQEEGLIPPVLQGLRARHV